jgi:hypothetical protein
MQSVGRGLRKDQVRRHAWLSLQAAIAKASYVETRELLQIAERARARAIQTADGQSRSREAAS